MRRYCWPRLRGVPSRVTSGPISDDVQTPNRTSIAVALQGVTGPSRDASQKDRHTWSRVSVSTIETVPHAPRRRIQESRWASDSVRRSIFHITSNTKICSWYFCSPSATLKVVGARRELPVEYKKFFRVLGHRIRTLRTDRKLSQEDMISYGFSTRHWQMLEAGRPSTITTLLRVSEVFGMPVEKIVAGLGPSYPKRAKQ
jgi:hypothetical protein